jgi:hypothetical protein
MVPEDGKNDGTNGGSNLFELKPYAECALEPLRKAMVFKPAHRLCIGTRLVT